MKNKGMSKKIMGLVLVASMLAPSLAFAAPVTKDETVFVTLSQDGTFKSAKVTNILRSDAALKNIKDKSTLENLKNVKGNDAPQKSGENIVWNSDQKEIYYQGDTKKALPLGVKITYFLNGKEISAKELAGKSGKIKIKIAYENKGKQIVNVKGTAKTMYTPLTIGTVLVLPDANFANITTNGAIVTKAAGNNMVTFASAPGLLESLGLDIAAVSAKLPSTLEINADATKCSMMPIYIAATPSFPNVDTLKAATTIDELNAGLNQLKDGATKLADGLNTLNFKVNNTEYDANGDPTGLKVAVGKINDAVKTVDTTLTTQITPGAATLATKLGLLKTNINTAATGATTLSNGLGSLSTNINALATGATTLNTAATSVKTGFTGTFTSGVNGLDYLVASNAASLSTTIAASNAQTQAIATAAGVPSAAFGVYTVGQLMTAISDSIQAQTVTTTVPGTPTLFDGINGIQTGTAQINTAFNAPRTAAGAPQGLKDAASDLSAGASQLNAGFNAPRNAAGEAQGFKDAASDLTAGAATLSGGLNQLQGAINTQLAPKMNKINTNVGLLGDATKQLSDGGSQISAGVTTLHGKLTPVTTMASEAIANMDALIKLSEQASTFTGKADDMDGSVKFIMQTGGIKEDAAVTAKDSKKAPVKQTQKSTWEKFKSLF